ncbi:hypothetical protein AB6A40_004310 [Gnathostoma spinigerum]|uniref:Rac GTPase-activating protein 1 n=1 Tax=Gnathostoma spinigerum TaxID=75299 RepID=A0ABD6ED64_9BILA
MISSEASRNVLKHYAEIISYADDFSRGREVEILKLLDLLERVRVAWVDEQAENRRLRENVAYLEQEIESLKIDLKGSKEQIRDARAQIAALMSDKRSVEAELAEKQGKLDLVRETLKDVYGNFTAEKRNKLAFLDEMQIIHPEKSPREKIPKRSAEVRSRDIIDEDIDYDKTGETLDFTVDEEEESRLRNGKTYRRSQAAQLVRGAGYPGKRSKNGHLEITREEAEETPYKRTRDGSDTLITAETKVYVDAEGRRPSKAVVTVRRRSNRSISESNILQAVDREVMGQAEERTPLGTLHSRHGAVSTYDLRVTPMTRSWTNGGSIETRPHTFVRYRSILGDKCGVCNGWIGVGGRPARKCEDCGYCAHRSCIDRAPVPCVPRVQTPKTPGKQRPRLKDFCPSNPPRIPHLIVHCVVALERNHLDCEGIYRIPGSESQIHRLLEDFKNPRIQPKLGEHDTETITGCIKRFLKGLRDSLIPSTSWDEFVNAVTTNDLTALHKAIQELPAPNRDTLAYLCVHFQKVCDNSARNRMTPEALARCVAPTIVGCPPIRTTTIAQSGEEAEKQRMIMEALLRLPKTYWQKFYCGEYNGYREANVKTPSHAYAKQHDALLSPSRTGYTSADEVSILGPVHTPPAGQKPLLMPSSRRAKFFGDPF